MQQHSIVGVLALDLTPNGFGGVRFDGDGSASGVHQPEPGRHGTYELSLEDVQGAVGLPPPAVEVEDLLGQSEGCVVRVVHADVGCIGGGKGAVLERADV